jgi:hypothetical protein
MASITAIELGTDTCALARTSVRRGEIRVSAVETLDPAAFPGLDALTVAVRQCRQTLKLPRRCKVVLWGLPEGANRRDSAVKPLLAPLTGAGFRVQRVVSPCNALAALARVKSVRGDGATCWLAINRGGVAIVVVRPGKQLYAHSFVWNSNLGSSGSQARLLQRYSLVSHLSPEVRRAMEAARRQGTSVDAVVTCGNLPDLRSLTMPLIEELDVEVETLDSLDGLVVAPAATERVTEAASAIRLACAGTIARGTRPWDESKRRTAHRSDALLRVAAVLAIVALGAFGYLWYERWRGTASTTSAAVSVSRGTPPPNSTAAPPPPPVVATKPAAAASNPPAVGAAPITPKSSPPAVSAAPVTPKSNPPAVSAVAPASKPKPPAVSAPAVASKPKPPAVSTPAVASKPKPPAANTPVPPRSNAPVASAPEPRVPSPEPRATTPSAVDRPVTLPAPAIPAAPAAGLDPVPSRTDKPQASPAVSTAPAVELGGLMPALLKDPVPRVTAILVSNERRFATVNQGQIVGIGDVIGNRIVVAIDDRAVVLREPSGVRIRVGLGGKILGVERER